MGHEHHHDPPHHHHSPDGHELPHEGHGHHSHGHSHGIIDPSIASTERGLWALKWSFVGLTVTAAIQVVVVVLVFHGIPSLSSRSHSPVIESEGEPQGAAVEPRDYRQCTLIV